MSEKELSCKKCGSSNVVVSAPTTVKVLCLNCNETREQYTNIPSEYFGEKYRYISAVCQLLGRKKRIETLREIARVGTTPAATIMVGELSQQCVYKMLRELVGVGLLDTTIAINSRTTLYTISNFGVRVLQIIEDLVKENKEKTS